MDDAGIPVETAARDHIRHTYALFADIRQRFDGPGVERGGHERTGVVPIYLKMAGDYAAQLFPELEKYTVESSFSEEQQRHVNAATLALREAIAGKVGGVALAARVVQCYLRETQPYFMLAMLKALEQTLRDLLVARPQHVATLDAIFRVAGGEGMRDLVRLYCAHLLEKALEAAETRPPEITAFVDIHDREEYGASGELHKTRYEVWCPGTDLAKEIFRQCREAAQLLVGQHQVGEVVPIAEEVAVLPGEISRYMTRFLQSIAAPLLQTHVGPPASSYPA
jgi:hypothetical protein